MKFGQSLAVSLAALLCTSSLALAQAPDKGGGWVGDRRPLRNGWKRANPVGPAAARRADNHRVA